jgi:3-demethoxyubiquinol 3-hydroxylase
VQPTLLAPLCSLAGYALGAGTALMGEKAAMACTVAVEEVIGEVGKMGFAFPIHKESIIDWAQLQHYNDQIKQLMADNPEANKELMETLQKMRDEEMEHHDTGVRNQGLEAPFYDGRSPAAFGFNNDA